MITEELVRKQFGDLWPYHNKAFNELLILCRRAFDGDLDKMIILSIIGERTLTVERAAGISYERFLEGLRGPASSKPINVQSISECTGIPRETVRRKIGQLIERGWVQRDESGLLFVLPQASRDLRPITEGTLEYLRRVGAAILRVAGRATDLQTEAPRPARHNGAR
jgi:hypothetical protein